MSNFTPPAPAAGNPAGTIFGREPALIIGAIAAILAVFIAFKVDFLTVEQAGLIEAFLAAVAAAWIALKTRPIAPTVFTGVITAGAALAAAYGFELSQEQVGAITAAVTAVMALLLRSQVTPQANLPGKPQTTLPTGPPQP